MALGWEDAQAFCAWLTRTERKAARIAANERYRLPSDHEWSCAVDIGGREDPAKRPDQKKGKITDEFPWGTAWPPPPGAGNYRGEEVTGTKDAAATLTGYRDEFLNASPVGSLAANRFGLFDLGGNASEYCEDWFDPDQKFHTLRGASFGRGERTVLLSSERAPVGATGRTNDLGFRVVLAADKAP